MLVTLNIDKITLNIDKIIDTVNYYRKNKTSFSTLPSYKIEKVCGVHLTYPHVAYVSNFIVLWMPGKCVG